MEKSFENMTPEDWQKLDQALANVPHDHLAEFAKDLGEVSGEMKAIEEDILRIGHLASSIADRIGVLVDRHSKTLTDASPVLPVDFWVQNRKAFSALHKIITDGRIGIDQQAVIDFVSAMKEVDAVLRTNFESLA